MAIKANNGTKEGIFSKAIEMLSMRGSMGKAKASHVANMQKEADNILKKSEDIMAAEKYSDEFKDIISESDFNNVNKRGAISSVMGIKSKDMKENAQKILDNKGITGANYKDQVAITAKGIKNYYTPSDDVSSATMALRYGTTATGVVGAGVAGRYIDGGTMTKDRNGNKDIAGIPFI